MSGGFLLDPAAYPHIHPPCRGSTETRIQRVINRDQKTKKDIESIIDNQLPESQKMSQSDFVIHNNSLLETEINIQNIHKEILNKIKNS